MAGEDGDVGKLKRKRGTYRQESYAQSKELREEKKEHLSPLRLDLTWRVNLVSRPMQGQA